jgi:hypothetical protein
MQKLAIDVGGVLIEKKSEAGADTNFDKDDVKWVPGALEAVDKLSTQFDLYVLSFCGKKTETETRQALSEKIIQYIPAEKWIFTRKREKKVDEMKKHGISGLVDDSSDIISLVTNAGLNGYLFRGEKYKTWETLVEDLSVKVAEK